MRYQKFSFRFAEQVLNSKLALKQELENVITDPSIGLTCLSRPRFNEILRDAFLTRGWEDQPTVFDEPGDPVARLDFMKERVGVEVEFGHSSFIGVDLLKFQVASHSGLDKIDVGAYMVTTRGFQRRMTKEYDQNWRGSLTFEKVVRYLPHLKSAIQVPIYVMGIELWWVLFVTLAVKRRSVCSALLA